MGEACQILGVNATTLRSWADAGRVRTFRTPGGHRRFSREDIFALTRIAPTGPVDGGSPSRGALERMRRRIQRHRGMPDEWLGRFDDEGKSRMRVLGRRLVSLATEYTTEKRRRTELEEEARYLGQDYGRELASRGVGLREAIAAFIFFRDSLREAMRQSPNGASASGGGLEDQVLMGMATAYERAEAPGAVAPQGRGG